MKDTTTVLAFITAVLCLMVGALLQNWILLGLSLVIAVGAFVLNKTLEHRYLYRIYSETVKPRPQTIDEEINAPDFFD